jgi:integrase
VNSRFTANSVTLSLPQPRVFDPTEGTDSHCLPRTREMMLTQRSPASATASTAGGQPLGSAVDTFLTERDLAPSTHRVYALVLYRLVAVLGAETPLDQITPPRLTRFVATTYGHLAPASHNRVVATLGSLFAYTTRQGATPTSPATTLERRRLRTDRHDHARTRAIPEPELLAFLTAEHPLRDKTLWWLLYDTAARASEILALDVDHLDLPRRRAVVIGKDARAELVGWETTTARLLPRLLRRRRHGPVFLTAIAPAPARQPALADLDPETGRARLSYRRAAEVFKDASRGWTLHQLRHSRLTHLAEAGIQLPMLMTKSRHTSLTSLTIYAKPTFDAVAAATAAIDPARRH